MYLVELRPGKEELYRTGDELAAAIRSGDVDTHSRIYHRATSKWISVTLHPQYKAIISEVRPSGPQLPPLERQTWTFFNDPTDELAGAHDPGASGGRRQERRRSQSAVAPAARAQRDGRTPDPGTAARRVGPASAMVGARGHGRVRSGGAGVCAGAEPELADGVTRRQLAGERHHAAPRTYALRVRSSGPRRADRRDRRAQLHRARAAGRAEARHPRAAQGGAAEGGSVQGQGCRDARRRRAGAALERGARRGARAAGERHPRGAAEPAVLGGPAQPGRRRDRDPHEPGGRGELRPGLPPAAGGDRSRVPGFVHGGGEDAGLDAGGGARVVRAGRAQGDACPGRR